MKKLNIIILQGAFLPIPSLMGGAVEKMWYILGKEFSKLDNQVTHISRQFPGLPNEELIDGVFHKRIAGYSAPKSMFKRILLDAIYSWRAFNVIPLSADVIITNSFWSPIFLLRNKHAVVYVDVARIPKGQLFLYARADCLRANSNAVVAAIKNELPQAEHCRISMVPNPLPFDVREVINFIDKKPVLLFCGRIHEEKGLELLAKAIKKIDLHGWRIQIVGPWDVKMGGSGNKYLQYLEKCFDKTDVTFLGPIFDESKLNDIYKNASIFVYPSLAEKGETFGLAPLEAMAWGCVPLVSNLACFKDFIHNDVNGLIFDHRSVDAVSNLAASIKYLIEDTQVRNALAIEAHKVNVSHSTTKIATQFITDFEKFSRMRRSHFE